MPAIPVIHLPPRRDPLLCQLVAVAGVTAISLLVVVYRYRQRRQRECVPSCWLATCAHDVLPDTP